MNGSIVWDVTSRSPLKVNRHFGGTCCLHLQGGSISQARNQRQAGRASRAVVVNASGWFLACRILPPWRWRRQLTFDRLHGVISQEIKLYLLLLLIILLVTCNNFNILVGRKNKSVLSKIWPLSHEFCMITYEPNCVLSLHYPSVLGTQDLPNVTVWGHRFILEENHCVSCVKRDILNLITSQFNNRSFVM
jgi:hypothetical protein